MTLKHLTSSFKVIHIFNKYGYCCISLVLQETETENDLFINDQKNVCPGVIKNPDLFTTAAFDNFDRYVETTSNKDSLHNTVSITHRVNKYLHQICSLFNN